MAYLHDVKKVGLDEPVVVCPVDPYVEEDYFQAIQTLSDLVEKDLARIVLMGWSRKVRVRNSATSFQKIKMQSAG